MKSLVSLINTSVLVFVVVFYLLAHLSPYQKNETPPQQIEGPWANQVLHSLDVWRHEISVYFTDQHHKLTQVYSRELKIAAVALLGLNILSLALSSLIPKRKQDKISLEVGGGTVSITIRALEDSLVRTLRLENYVKDAKITVQPTISHIQIKAYLTLIESSNLHTLEEKILDKMRQHFGTIFPVDKPVDYEVVIHKLRPSAAALTPSSSSQVEPSVTTSSEPSYIAQPRYPDRKQP